MADFHCLSRDMEYARKRDQKFLMALDESLAATAKARLLTSVEGVFREGK